MGKSFGSTPAKFLFEKSLIHSSFHQIKQATPPAWILGSLCKSRALLSGSVVLGQPRQAGLPWALGIWDFCSEAGSLCCKWAALAAAPACGTRGMPGSKPWAWTPRESKKWEACKFWLRVGLGYLCAGKDGAHRASGGAAQFSDAQPRPVRTETSVNDSVYTKR